MRYFVFVFFLSIFALPANAEPLTLSQMVDLALKNTPGVAQARLDYENRLADGIEASTLEDPTVQVDITRKRRPDSMTGTDIEIEQPLKLSYLSGARGNYAAALKSVATQEQKYEILRTISEARNLYMQYWVLSERRKLLSESATEAGKVAKAIGSSAHSGQTSQADYHLFHGDALKLKSDVKELDAELSKLRVAVSKMIGQSVIGEPAKPEFKPVTANIEQMAAFAEGHANGRNILRAQAESAKKRLAVAEQDSSLPEISPRLIYSQAGGRDEESIGIGVALRIPLWDGNRAERQRARSELSHAQTRLDTLSRLPLQETLAQLQQSVLRSQERADSYWGEIVPTYRKSYKNASAMWSSGQLSALDLWQIRERLFEAEQTSLEAAADAYVARTELELELGGILEEIQ